MKTLYSIVLIIDRLLCRFVTVHALDRHTDRRTDRQTDRQTERERPYIARSRCNRTFAKTLRSW